MFLCTGKYILVLQSSRHTVPATPCWSSWMYSLLFNAAISLPSQHIYVALSPISKRLCVEDKKAQIWSELDVVFWWEKVHDSHWDKQQQQGQQKNAQWAKHQSNLQDFFWWQSVLLSTIYIYWLILNIQFIREEKKLLLLWHSGCKWFKNLWVFFIFLCSSFCSAAYLSRSGHSWKWYFKSKRVHFLSKNKNTCDSTKVKFVVKLMKWVNTLGLKFASWCSTLRLRCHLREACDNGFHQLLTEHSVGASTVNSSSP